MIFLSKFTRAAKMGAIPVIALSAFASALPMRAQNPPAPVHTAPPVVAPDTGEEPDGSDAPDNDVVTLADALAKARFGRAGLAMAVNADRERLTKKDADAKKVDTVSRAIIAFNLSSRDFGGVTAIGPETYTELETDFSKANAFPICRRPKRLPCSWPPSTISSGRR